MRHALVTLLLAAAPFATAADAPKPYAGRSASEREKLLLTNGGTKESEAAIARGLKWLADNQVKTTGAWVFDGTSRAEVIAATGMGVLPFLAAGHTHKKGDKDKPNPFQKNVEAGLKFLIASQLPTGAFRGSSTMYAHGIATLALCEAYSMTGDKTLLLAPAKAAVAYILRGQGPDGSWGYSAGTKGDTSILGWQLQALHAAKQTKDIPVPDVTIKKAKEFLDKVAKGDKKAEYGYTSNETTTPTLSAIGLWGRYCFDGWDAAHPGLDAGAAKLVRNVVRFQAAEDSYGCYYLTLVLRSRGGALWETDWNPKVRDGLLKKQAPDADGPRTAGSWPADKAYIGTHCGRVGTTAMTLLTLQVYYRVPPPVPPAKK